MDGIGVWGQSSALGSGRLVVIGSVNVDLGFRVDRLPGPGETVLGVGDLPATGGKGANQAVAAARSGCAVAFVGAIGDDEHGEWCRSGLLREGVDVSRLHVVPRCQTGVAVVVRDDAGENQIVVAPNANDALSGAVVVQDLEELAVGPADVCLTSFEVPPATVDATALYCFGARTRLVVNPAPARPMSDRLLMASPLLTPNETEARSLSGSPLAADAVRELGLRTNAPVVVTLGARGVLLGGAKGSRLISGRPVEVIDTTGAGDVFSGVLAAGLASGRNLDEAVHRAVAAAGLSVTGAGARSAIPSASTIEREVQRLPRAHRDSDLPE